jgi:hypothetical protein
MLFLLTEGSAGTARVGPCDCAGAAPLGAAPGALTTHPVDIASMLEIATTIHNPP